MQTAQHLPATTASFNRLVATHAKRVLTMRAYLMAAGMALGLLARWAALVPFVA
jgi:hypothetical protein